MIIKIRMIKIRMNDLKGKNDQNDKNDKKVMGYKKCLE